MKNYNVLADCKEMYEQDVIDTIIQNRGINDIEHFLNPRPEDMYPLSKLNNIAEGYELLKDACDNEKKIVCLADVDTDGVTSGTIITRYIREVQNCPCECLINDNKSHGLKGQDLERFEDTDLLIIVDSLDADEECYKKLKEDYNVGNILVLDHHNIDPSIPYSKYITLISSQDNYPNPELSGAGVCFKFICYCEEQDNGDLYYAEQYSDLAACGILADVCSVAEESYENRYIVSLGLSHLNNPGLKKIVGSYDFTSKSVLFSISPLINASVRMGKTQDAINLLLADDNKEVLKYKKVLENCKEEQNYERDRLVEVVKEQLQSQKDSNVLYAFVDTQYGVSGLIANMLLEEYNKPILILNKGEDVYAGSMRSIGYGDFAQLCRDTELAEVHGHQEAAGIFINKKDFDKFISTINEVVDKIKQTTSEEINIDAELNYSDITSLLCDKVLSINKITGKGFKPLTFKVIGMNDYSIGSWKQGKHLLFNSNGALSFIEWNTKANMDDMQDHSLMGDEIIGYGELEKGMIGRNFMIKLILSDYYFE